MSCHLTRWRGGLVPSPCRGDIATALRHLGGALRARGQPARMTHRPARDSAGSNGRSARMAGALTWHARGGWVARFCGCTATANFRGDGIGLATIVRRLTAPRRDVGAGRAASERDYPFIRSDPGARRPADAGRSEDSRPETSRRPMEEEGDERRQFGQRLSQHPSFLNLASQFSLRGGWCGGGWLRTIQNTPSCLTASVNCLKLTGFWT
jgi:hypothetical protein